MYLLIEEFPEGEFNVVDSFDTPLKAAKVKRELQKGYIVNLDNSINDEQEVKNLFYSVYKQLANYFKVSFEEVTTSRKKEIAAARHILRGKMMELTGYTLVNLCEIESDVTQNSNNIHHSTLINSLDHYQRIMIKPEDYEERILKVINNLM